MAADPLADALRLANSVRGVAREMLFSTPPGKREAAPAEAAEFLRGLRYSQEDAADLPVPDPALKKELRRAFEKLVEHCGGLVDLARDLSPRLRKLHDSAYQNGIRPDADGQQRVTEFNALNIPTATEFQTREALVLQAAEAVAALQERLNLLADSSTPTSMAPAAPPVRGTRSDRPRPDLRRWALASPDGKKWYSFCLTQSRWEQRRPLRISNGKQKRLMAFMLAGGCLKEEEAFRLWPEMLRNGERDRISSALKPVLSRLRRSIEESLGIDRDTMEVLPRDEGLPGWRPAVRVVHATRDGVKGKERWQLKEPTGDDLLDL
jgi:hypothetical protein